MPRKSTTNTNEQSGNILIYIIGAIFLIGLLTILLKGSNTPGSNIDQETLILKASQVREYAAELERGVRYVYRNGVSETQISFAHPNHSSDYGTYGTTPTAEIFHPNGGGVEWQDNDTDIQIFDSDWAFTAVNEIEDVGTTCAGDSCADLIVILYELTLDFCNVMNELIGGFPDTPPQTQTVFEQDAFDGSYSYIRTISDVGSDLDGRTEGCFMNVGGTNYGYYKVLLSR